MEHEEGHWLVHEECIACTAVCQKIHLGLKQCQAVKNQAGSISNYRLKASVRQLVSRKLQ